MTATRPGIIAMGALGPRSSEPQCHTGQHLPRRHRRWVSLTALLVASTLLVLPSVCSFVIGNGSLGAKYPPPRRGTVNVVELPGVAEEVAEPHAEGWAARAALGAAFTAVAVRLAQSFAAAVPKREAAKSVPTANSALQPTAGFLSASSAAGGFGGVSSSASGFLGSSMAGSVTAAAPDTASGMGSAATSMKMMFEKFNEKAIKVVMRAQEEARRLGHNFVSTEMLLVGVISENTGISANVMKKLGVNVKDARKTAEELVGRGNGVVANEIPFTPAAKKSLANGIEEAKLLNCDTIDPAHILLAMTKQKDSGVSKVFEKLNVDQSQIPVEITKELKQLLAKDDEKKEAAGVTTKGGKGAKSGTSL